MVNSPGDYKEAYERIANTYFSFTRIQSKETREERSAEFIRQLGDLDKIGIVLAAKDQYRHANYLYKQLADEPLDRDAWEARDLSKFLRKAQARRRARDTRKRSPYRKIGKKIFGFEIWNDGGERVVPRDEKGRFIGKIQ